MCMQQNYTMPRVKEVSAEQIADSKMQMDQQQANYYVNEKVQLQMLLLIRQQMLKQKHSTV